MADVITLFTIFYTSLCNVVKKSRFNCQKTSNVFTAENKTVTYGGDIEIQTEERREECR